MQAISALLLFWTENDQYITRYIINDLRPSDASWPAMGRVIG
jgi:hypothetical protein